MPKPTLALKATVTRRQAEPIPSDMAERLEQLHPDQADENARQTAVEAATAIESEKSGKPLSGKPTRSKPRSWPEIWASPSLCSRSMASG